MAEQVTRIGVLASGQGTLLEAVQGDIDKGEIHGIEIGAVVCNNGPENPDASVWEKARRLGIDIVHISNKTGRHCTLPEVDGEPVKGTISFEASQQLLELADDRGILMFAGLGYKKKVIGEVLQKIPTANAHRGPLGPKKLTAGKKGNEIEKEVMRLGLEYGGPTLHWMDKRLDDHGLPAYDMGEEIGHEPVKVTPDMRQEWVEFGRVDLLEQEDIRVEKHMVPHWIVKAASQL